MVSVLPSLFLTHQHRRCKSTGETRTRTSDCGTSGCWAVSELEREGLFPGPHACLGRHSTLTAHPHCIRLTDRLIPLMQELFTEVNTSHSNGFVVSGASATIWSGFGRSPGDIPMNFTPVFTTLLCCCISLLCEGQENIMLFCTQENSEERWHTVETCLGKNRINAFSTFWMSWLLLPTFRANTRQWCAQIWTETTAITELEFVRRTAQNNHVFDRLCAEQTRTSNTKTNQSVHPQPQIMRGNPQQCDVWFTQREESVVDEHRLDQTTVRKTYNAINTSTVVFGLNDRYSTWGSVSVVSSHWT